MINEKKIKLIRPIVFFVGFSLMSSCSPDSVDENYQIVTFTEKDISKSTQLKSKTYRDSSIFMPKMIKLVDDGKLILIDQERDTIIHVFGFSDSILVHENSFGIEGQGPGELGQITDLYRANEPNHFWVQQMAMKKMSLFSSNQSTLYPVQEIDAAQGKLFNAICMTPATDST
ncbi:MAG: hypothetical protein JJU23_06775, partial [Cyclobacteriaceae bacterium]|nr:hypothetical protein [Cyclobacteriaceae bacterium]